MPILLVVVYIYTIVDILRSNLSGKLKILWVIVCLCLPFLGTVLYYIMGKTMK
ncbi:MAG: PLD nuclease N-terminal domain-containing protein [Flavobacteriales bacterium]|nr:PLD nuclease N-terminal domain-containing protein [Flavobacteriales bacterium]